MPRLVVLEELRVVDTFAFATADWMAHDRGTEHCPDTDEKCKYIVLFVLLIDY